MYRNLPNKYTDIYLLCTTLLGCHTESEQWGGNSLITNTSTLRIKLYKLQEMNKHLRMVYFLLPQHETYFSDSIMRSDIKLIFWQWDRSILDVEFQEFFK